MPTRPEGAQHGAQDDSTGSGEAPASPGTPGKPLESAVPAASLKYWIRANQRALARGRQLGPEHFLLVNFDELCAAPADGLRSILRFLEVADDDVDFDRLCQIPRAPSSLGRYRDRDLSQFSAEDLDSVRQLGFPTP